MAINNKYTVEQRRELFNMRKKLNWLLCKQRKCWEQHTDLDIKINALRQSIKARSEEFTK